MSRRPFAHVEQEAIILNAAWSMIDGMVNYVIFNKSDTVENVTLLFNGLSDAKLFNILLVDFLSLPNVESFQLPHPPPGGKATDRTYLFYLQRICGAPQLNSTAQAIQEPLEAFVNWLEGETLVKGVWLPSVEIKADMRVRRIDFLKICGDIAKHNFARLSINVTRICNILAAHGHIIDERQAFLVLPDFYEWFHENIFVMHSSAIAQFLNDLRWGIFHYLQAEFTRSYERVDPEPMYRYKYPSDCIHPLGRAMYWDLMNMVRARPYFRQFKAAQFTKGDNTI